MGRYFLRIIAIISFCVLYAPLVTMVVVSFRVPMDSAISNSDSWTWGMVWYEKLLVNQSLSEALWRSLKIALISSFIATIIGTLGALALENQVFRGQRILRILTGIPLVIPELAMGLSMLMWFTFLNITLGMVSITLAHITFCLSYVTVTVRNALKDFDPLLEDAALDLGASARKVFWRVKFPLIRPGIIGGSLMAFMLSFDDFIITYYTAGPGADTLPLKLYSMIRLHFSPEAYSLSALLLIATLGIISVATWISRGRFLRYLDS